MAWYDPITTIINLATKKPSSTQWYAALQAYIDKIEALAVYVVPVSTSNPGYCPQLDGNTTHFLRSDGVQAVPAGTGIGLGGATGATDEAILLADGVSTDTIKTSNITIETTLTDDDTKVPTSGAVSDALAILPLRVLYSGISGTTQAAAVNAGYIPLNAALTTITLPTTAAVGDVVAITGYGAGMWKLAQNASQLIRFLSLVTTTGTGGYIQATTQYDAITVRCVVADTTWVVENAVGNLDVI